MMGGAPADERPRLAKLEILAWMATDLADCDRPGKIELAVIRVIDESPEMHAAAVAEHLAGLRRAD
jgi:hypothetical protein